MAGRTSGSTAGGRAGSRNQSGTTGRRRRDEPLEVHIEFVVLDGAAGKQLRGRQAAIMRKVLRWLRDNPPNPGDDADGTGKPIGRFDIT